VARFWLVLAWVALAGFVAVTAWVYGLPEPTGLDAAWAATATTVRTPELSAAASLLTVLGSPPVVAVVAAIASIVLWWRTEGLLLPVVMAVTVLETACVVYLTKIVTGRQRPAVADMVGRPALDGSFPSGHTTDGTVVYLLTALLLGSVLTRAGVRRLGYAVATLLALGIGLTRIYLGYHWASDVLAGWLLAVAACAAACYAVCRLRPSDLGPPAPRADLDRSRIGPRAVAG
jgi:undecaprenyl-diphosphatase